MDRRRCVVLVPYTGYIEPACEEPLKELERRGYAVRRVRGFAAIDQARNQLATDAMIDGYEETLWIDSDVEFHPNDVDRGYRILADTTIRLYHIGKQRYGWEDAGIDRQRFPAFSLHLEGQPELLKRD